MEFGFFMYKYLRSDDDEWREWRDWREWYRMDPTTKWMIMLVFPCLTCSPCRSRFHYFGTANSNSMTGCFAEIEIISFGYPWNRSMMFSILDWYLAIFIFVKNGKWLKKYVDYFRVDFLHKKHFKKTGFSILCILPFCAWNNS